MDTPRIVPPLTQERHRDTLAPLLTAIDDVLDAWQREAECSTLMPPTIKACERLAAMKHRYEEY